MGLCYMGTSASNNARFPSEGTPQHSPVYSVESGLASSRHSTVPFYSNVFPPALANSSAYSNSSPSYLSDLSNHCMPDIKQNFSSSDMLPPSKSPHLSQTNSSMPAQDPFIAYPQQLRHHTELLTRSPPLAGTMMNIPILPTSSCDFISPHGLDSPQPADNSHGSPPLSPTELLYQNIQTTDGQQIRPEISGKLGKGLFLVENVWTCYRNNYLQINCSYTLHPKVPTGTIMNLMQGSQLAQIQAFAVSISAVVHGEHGQPMELVQHTPKRKKGPQTKPDRVVLLPRSVNTTLYNGLNADGTLSNPNYAQVLNRPPTNCTFERIQFKEATANNGKGRARQQYYHLVIELFADLGPQHGDGRWAKIARRVSAQVVVRGRSPGHYRADKRRINVSAGPGAANSQCGNIGGYSPIESIGGRSVNISLSGASSLMSGGGYGTSYGTSRSRQLTASIDVNEPIMGVVYDDLVRSRDAEMRTEL